MATRKMCVHCTTSPAAVRRPRNGDFVCKPCFLEIFQEEVHHTIVSNNLFTPGDRVALGASGGKDSTVLIDLLVTLNQKYNYGVEFLLLSIDEGIVGYRDDSLITVGRNKDFYNLPLTVKSYKDLYGWSMDEIVAQIGSKSNCTFCGVFRRQALDRGALALKANKIATGHNADDVAETVLMNFLRADSSRLQRCTSITTSSEGTIPRVKPLKYAYEKEIVLYAHFKKLDYFTTECTYSKEAFRGNARTFLKELEVVRSEVIIDVVRSGEDLFDGGDGGSGSVGGGAGGPTQTLGHCSQCGYMTSGTLCRACQLLESLNKGKPKVALKRERE
eukprot:PhF_6_TR19792/c0_g1_i1/m.28859/K14168/CTU1, NCS6; cytoplasmic tRNA 2-thiolation protein 1